ncbi:hypothetical protein ACFO5O_11175 [Geojedonia litorea]|uniref:Lipoprotein n=1 Tax=Geojedonia litorea TaxID=1268269 RepID=A0ABV9N4A3_9FLAO
MKKLIIVFCVVVFSCNENHKHKTQNTKQIKFENQIVSSDDIEILNEGFKNNWEIIKDEQLSLLVNRDVIYYIFKNPTDEQLKHRFYLHVVIKETEEFINLDFNFNEHLLVSKTSNAIYKIASRKLPLKHILSITTGQVLDGKSLWEVYINDSNIY